MEKNTRHRIVLVSLIMAGLVIRSILAPYTTGSDIAQFAGFADTFLRHGICFYKYSGSASFIAENWPYNWPYVYGPPLILFLGLLRLFVHDKVIHYYDTLGHYYVYVPVNWIIACKALFILFDTLSAIMIYLIIKRITGRASKALLGMTVYYFNPMTIYVSSIYGMFDPIAFFFLLASLYFIINNKRILGALSMGLSLVIKQTMLFPTIYYLLYTLRSDGIKRFIRDAVLIVLPGIVFMAPFMLCPGSIDVFLENLKMTGNPTYTYPISYSFNGFSSLATYLNSISGSNTLWVIKYWFVPALLLTIVYVFMLARKGGDPLLSIVIGYLVYIATYWRINAQYLLPAIGLLAVAFFHPLITGRARIAVAASIFLIGFWPIMFPTSWWAHVHIRSPNMFIWRLLDFFSLMVFDRLYYVCYSILLTLTLYVTIITLISRIHRRII